MAVDWQEWRDHFLLHSLDNMEDVLYFWKHSTVLDIGECLTIPDEFSETEKLTSMWWKQLVAGVVAGAMSWRGTAPLDGLKVCMQIHASKPNSRTSWGASGRSMRWACTPCGVAMGLMCSRLPLRRPSSSRAVSKQAIQGHQETLHVQGRFVAGSLAGATSQTIIYPMEVLKMRLTLRQKGQ